MKTLYLIDGYAAFFRAYYAIRGRMTSPVTEEPTNAVYGFVAMLIKLLREQKPDYLAVVLDVSGDRGTFRSEIYPEYKANRDAPPEDFGPQVERCLQILEALDVPTIGAEGYEADDVIATLATQLAGDDLHVRVVSKDKDLMQLLGERVDLFDSTSSEVIDVEHLRENLGITPQQMTDVLALAGDTVDNVPGVPGIGVKTAAKLIGQFGSLDELLERLDELKGKRKENIEASRDLLPLSKDLVTLRHDIKLDFDLEQTRLDPRELPVEQADKLLVELGFNRMREDLAALAGVEVPTQAEQRERSAAEPSGDAGLFGDIEEGEAVPSAPERGDYRAITTKKDLDAFLKQVNKAQTIAVDTETDSLHARSARLCGLSFSVEAGAGVYIPTRSPDHEKHLDTETVIEALRPILEDPKKPKVGHNLKYDIQVLRGAGVHLAGSTFDTMIASYVIDAARSSHKLDHLALGLLGYQCIPITDLIGTKGRGKTQKRFDEVPLEQAIDYAAEDADITLRLMHCFQPLLEKMELTKLFQETEMPLVEVLAELEWNGIRVDREELDNQAAKLKERIEELRLQILNESPRDFNPDSPKQLSGVLFNAPDAAEPGLGLKPIKKTKTGYSTDVEVLEKLAADPDIPTPVPALIVEYRNLSKLVGTYLTALAEAINPETGRVHASFNQTVAATGRLSSSEPNLQNIPIRTEIGRAVRKAFRADDGNLLVSADYSQIELRILAHLSEDPALVDAFNKGLDIHTAVAAQVFDVKPDDVTREQRSGAKMVNFGIVYGITPYGLARRLGAHPDGTPWGVDEAGEIITNYKKRFSRIELFLQDCVQQAKRHGYVETMLGRQRAIPQIDARNPQQRNLGERMAINSVVQGSAADLIKLAMIDLYRTLPDVCAAAKMLLQIHDELVFECPKGEAEAVQAHVVQRMEGAMELRVPLKAEAGAGETWFEGK